MHISKKILSDATVVLDIGKTNAKLTLMDAAGTTLEVLRCPNTIVDQAPYPHHDTERLWDWIRSGLRTLSPLASIKAIVPVTHGATAALVDEDGLVLPVLDYEFALPASFDAQYQRQRPTFSSSYSPALPAGLNLGRQLAWLAQEFPAEFSRSHHILMYPQYWAWRLSGVAASEVTSLGCHTDMWDTAQQTYSTLISRMKWSHLLPPMRHAWDTLGSIHPDLASSTGLPPDCQILCGIHDSNASLLPYLNLSGAGSPGLTVLSTGTWAIAAAFGTPLTRLKESADMLANTNALGHAVACMRFMGGREFAALAGDYPSVCSTADLQHLIKQGSYALPCFAESGGPFSGRVGSMQGTPAHTPQERYALATLYCVLMTDYCLSALGASGPVIVEGSFTGNPYFAPLLAALRPQQEIAFSTDASGTTKGGWMLQHWGSVPALTSTTAAPAMLDGWLDYRVHWLGLVAEYVG